jgi:hypothetical protein
MTCRPPRVGKQRLPLVDPRLGIRVDGELGVYRSTTDPRGSILVIETHFGRVIYMKSGDVNRKLRYRNALSSDLGVCANTARNCAVADRAQASSRVKGQKERVH